MEIFEELENKKEEFQEQLKEKYNQINDLHTKRTQEIEKLNNKYEDDVFIINGEINTLVLKIKKIENEIEKYNINCQLEYIESIKNKHMIIKLNLNNGSIYNEELIILKIENLTLKENGLIDCDYTLFYYHIDKDLKLNLHITQSNGTYWNSSELWNNPHIPIYELNNEKFKKLLLELQENITDYQITGELKTLREILSNCGIDVDKLDLRTIEQKISNELENC